MQELAAERVAEKAKGDDGDVVQPELQAKLKKLVRCVCTVENLFLWFYKYGQVEITVPRCIFIGGVPLHCLRLSLESAKDEMASLVKVIEAVIHWQGKWRSNTQDADNLL